MEKITNIAELRAAILDQEILNSKTQEALKEQFKTTYQSLKPANLLKTVLKDLANQPDLKGNLANAAMSLLLGHASKKIMIGSTHNPLKQLLGILIQTVVTKLTSENANEIRSSTSHLIKKFFPGSKKEVQEKDS